MPATWPPLLDCIGTPLVIEPSVDQRSRDASARADRSPHDHDLTRPVVGVSSAVALGLLPVIRDARRQARDLVQATPASYLMRLEEGLQPKEFFSRVMERLRKFVLGI